MAENIETPELPKVIKTPSLPTKGQLGMKEALGLSEPFMQEKARLLPKITEAKGAVEEAKQAQQVTGLAGEEQAVKQFATEEKGAQDAYQAKIEKEPLPAFIPSKENANDIAGLFSMVSVMGALLGGTGKLNSMQALSAMNGMLEGHQKGRADLYKKQATEFDKAFKGMLQKHSEFRKEMEDAIRLAATNKEAGVAAARLAAAKAGSPVVKKMLDQDRLVDAYKLVDQSQTLAENAFKAEAKLRSEAAREEAAERRHLADMKQRKELAQLRSDDKKQGLSGGLDVALTDTYGFPKNEVARLNAKDTLPTTVATVYSAEQTKKLADDIKNNKDAAGLALSFINKIDKYLPSRYDTSSADSGVALMSNAADQEITGDNPSVVTKARQIAKDAVDVINARALAASGGKRVLVSELRMQKDVIGLENMSPESAVGVFNGLAKKDLQSLKKFGFSPKTLDDAEKRILGSTSAAPSGSSDSGLTPEEKAELAALKEKHGRK